MTDESEQKILTTKTLKIKMKPVNILEFTTVLTRT